MEAIFGFQEVLQLVKFGIQELEEGAIDAQKAALKELKKIDCKALFLIHQCVDVVNFEKIASAKTSKQAWDVLLSIREWRQDKESKVSVTSKTI